jgi:hypothetical protein
MPAPDFLCVGMPKCGTSTLYDVCRRQGGVFVPPIKEIKFLAFDKMRYKWSRRELFFSNHWTARQDRRALIRLIKRFILCEEASRDLAWAWKYAFARRDFHWYFSLFVNDRISGDISPVYHTLGQEEIKHIAAIMPDLKVVVLLRSPLQQIWSHCRMVVVRQEKQRSSEVLRRHIEGLTLARRTYRSLIEDWSSEFMEKVFIGYLEDMATDQAGFFCTLFRFLGVKNPERSIACDAFVQRTRSHVGIPYDVPEDVRAVLADHAAIRMEGFDAVAPHRASEWRAELEDFRHAARKPRDPVNRAPILESLQRSQ